MSCLPSRALRPCKDHECSNLTRDASGYCPEHIHLVEELKKERWQRQDTLRGSARDRGYDSRWEKVRRIFLMKNPLCHDCMAEGKFKPANEVHHVKKVRDHPELRLACDNLMSLCKSCHSKRTFKGE